VARGEGGDPGLVGTWRVQVFEEHSDKGARRVRFGEHPKGLLIYDATGHMAIQLMRVPHPRVESEDTKLSIRQKAELYDAYTAYFGTYRVDLARKVIIHHAEADMQDAFIGHDEERHYSLVGNVLTLNPTWEEEGVRWTGNFVFERVTS
jgi:hypothetical protein